MSLEKKSIYSDDVTIEPLKMTGAAGNWTEEKVVQMRKDGKTYREIKKAFTISNTTMARIFREHGLIGPKKNEHSIIR